MIKNKLRILSFVIVAILAQGTFAYAASSSSSSSSKKTDDYTKDDFDNIAPGFEAKDIDISNKRVDSYVNTFASANPPSVDDTKTSNSSKNSTTKTTTTGTADAGTTNTIVSTAPSTGRSGDFWGKTGDGKWILIEQGAPATGWRNVRGKWYYMDSDGVMQTGWINDGSTWYYLNTDGAMAYNTYVDGYYLDWTGAMQ